MPRWASQEKPRPSTAPQEILRGAAAVIKRHIEAMIASGVLDATILAKLAYEAVDAERRGIREPIQESETA
jgi:hypothetical protein